MIHRLTIDAFALSPDIAETFKAVRDDRSLSKSRVEVLAGGLAAAVDHYRGRVTPQVILVEVEGDSETVMAGIDRLAEVCEPGTRVIVIGHVNDITLYRTLLAHGVSDYMVRPVAARQILGALAEAFSDPAAAARGRSVGVWGVRGGVGTSALAQNLAWSIGRATGEGAIYIDFDIPFGSSLLAFNLEAKQTVVDALAHPERLDEQLIERFLVAYDEHLQVLPAPGDPRAQMAVGIEAVDKLLDMTLRVAPAVVVDIPHVWAPWTEHLLSAVDDLVVVATPDLFCLKDTKILLDLVGAKRGEATRLVLNRADAARRTQLSPKDFQENISLEPTLVIPFDPQLFGEAGNNGQMLGETAKTHKVVEQIQAFAGQLAGRTGVAKKRGGERGGLRSLLSSLMKKT
jgi:pilus assembly protein CpaE